MNNLLVGLLGAVLATNQPQSVSNLIEQKTGVSVAIPDPNDPAQKQLEQLMAEDDKAMAEVNKWVQENAAFAEQGGGESKAELHARIMARLNIVRKHYEDFLQHYPNFAAGHLAFASFLNDIGDEEGGKAENEKALKLDPKNPAAWNNLANYYSPVDETALAKLGKRDLAPETAEGCTGLADGLPGRTGQLGAESPELIQEIRARIARANCEAASGRF